MSIKTGVLAAAPALAPAYEALHNALWSQTHIPPATLALCRLRLAQLHDSAEEIERSQPDLSSAKGAALRRWHTEALFSAQEKACLAFTEVYAMDVQALTDEHANAVKSHFGESGLVLLIEALGILDAKIRIDLLWQGLDVEAGESV